MKLTSFFRGIKAAIRIHSKDRFHVTGDVRRVLTYIIDFSICASVASAMAGDKNLIVKDVNIGSFAIVYLLVLLSLRSLLFGNRSIGMVITGTHLVLEDKITKANWQRILLRDSITPIVVALILTLSILSIIFNPSSGKGAYKFLGLFILIGIVTLNRGSFTENGTSKVDSISRTRLRKR